MPFSWVPGMCCAIPGCARHSDKTHAAWYRIVADCCSIVRNMFGRRSSSQFGAAGRSGVRPSGKRHGGADMSLYSGPGSDDPDADFALEVTPLFPSGPGTDPLISRREREIYHWAPLLVGSVLVLVLA